MAISLHLWCSPTPCNPCPLIPAEGTVALTANGQASAATGVVTVDFRLWGVPPSGDSALLVDWTAATPTDGTFDSSSESYSIGGGRDNAGYVAYDLDVRATAGGSTATVSQRVPFEHDTTAPVSSVNTLPASTTNSPYPIAITATDNWPPPNSISVGLWYRYRAKTNQAWGVWTEVVLARDSTPPYVINFGFPSGKGYYEFYSIATDQRGNVEVPPAAADAWTQKR